VSLITVKHDQGKRYVATCGEYSVSAGTAEENPERNGMSPGRLLIAALGMCTLGDILPFCERHDILPENITVELDVEKTDDESRAATVCITIKVAQKLSKAHEQAIVRASQQCYVRQSLTHGVDVKLSISSD
jgi:uncharacterized OsmC-like protein